MDIAQKRNHWIKIDGGLLRKKESSTFIRQSNGLITLNRHFQKRIKMGEVIQIVDFKEKMAKKHRANYVRLLDQATKLDEQGKTSFKDAVIVKVKAERKLMDKYATPPKPYGLQNTQVLVSHRETSDYMELDINIFPKDIK